MSLRFVPFSQEKSWRGREAKQCLKGPAEIARSGYSATGTPAVESKPRTQGGTRKPEFWLGAIDPVVQRDRKVFVPSDYMELFAPPLKWPTVVGRTSTFEISTQLVMRGTPEEQQTVLSGLRADNLKLAGQFGVLEQPADPACGPHLEGMGVPLAAENVAKRLQAMGGKLDYLDMDEPVTWGRESPAISVHNRWSN